MLGFNKVLGCILFIWSLSVYSGFMGAECSGKNISLPCENLKWDIEGKLLYLQMPSWPNELNQYQDPDLIWRFGFQLKTAIHYRSGNDFNVQWYDFRNHSTQNLTQPLTLNNMSMHAPHQVIPNIYDSFLINQESIDVKLQWDQVNIEFAKNIDLGDSDKTRFHGGFNYSRINETNHLLLIGQTTLNHDLNTFEKSDLFNSTYSGFGFRSGMDLTHFWSLGLMAYAKAAVSILAGSAKSTVQWNDLMNGADYTGLEKVSRHRIVPEFDGQLGFSYRLITNQGSLTIHLGWLWVNYFSALGQTENHFGIQGANFGLQWTGDMI